MRLFLDLDGVLLDFERAIAEHGIETYPESRNYIHLPENQWPPEMVEADKAYKAVMERPDFWNTLRPMKDAHKLWCYCLLHFSPFSVLTAVPKDTKRQFDIGIQKRHSIWKHFSSTFPYDNIIVCKRSEKASYCRFGDILVDDTPANCREWEAAGGIAILHVSAENTIERLRTILQENRPIPTKADHARSKSCDSYAGLPLVAPALRHYTSEERKAAPVHTGVMLYFPDALMAVARVSKKGNDKHNPGEPLHWSRDKSADQSDCVGRHYLSPDVIDPDSGETERAHATWRALADLQIAEEKRLIAAGIRPLSGITE